LPYPTVTLTPPPALDTRPLHQLAVVLVSPRNTLNIGAVARAMSNFGCADLRVANIFYQDFRSASSAVGPSAELLRSARDYPTTAHAVEDAQLVVGTTGAPDRPFLQPIERLETGARRIRAALDQGRRVALLFGSEKFGLSNDDMSHCHLLLRIPTREAHPSMNLGQAAALCLYELARLDPTAADSTAPDLTAPDSTASDSTAPDPTDQDPADQDLAVPATTAQPENPAPHSESQTPQPQKTTYALPQNFPRDAGAPEPASALAMERLTGMLESALTTSEYPGTGTPARTRQLRTLLRRLHVTERDAILLTGFLRQMLWKLGAPPED
jgi:TrmH family RNA methyltransferase